MSTLKWVVDTLIFATVFLGLVLLYVLAQLFTSGQIPGFLLAGIFGGEFAYAATSLAVAKRYRWSYYVIFGLAVLVLAVSLPQPQHYAFASEGQVGPFLIFATGSVLQVCLLVLIPVYLFTTRARKNQVDPLSKAPSGSVTPWNWSASGSRATRSAPPVGS